MATQTQAHQPMENRPTDSSGFYGWVIFWLIVAIVVVGAIAYAAYRPMPGSNLNPSDTSTTMVPPDTTTATPDNGPAGATNSNMAPASPDATTGNNTGNVPGAVNPAASPAANPAVNGAYQYQQPNGQQNPANNNGAGTVPAQ